MAPLQQFEHIVDIQPDDVFGGHVNNARYFAYIGATFHEWYEAMGISYGSTRTGTPLMAHQSLDFLREMSYPGRVLCRLTTTRLGRSSLEHAIELRDADHPDQFCGKGRAVNVWVDRESGQTAPWPADLVVLCWAE